MASSPVPGPSSTMSNLLPRTPLQELEIVKESIEVLKRNVGLAQSNRLKAGRLRVERYEALKDLEQEVDEADETLEEHRLVAESLRKDIDGLLKVQKRWNNRLTVATEERIGFLSDAVQEKTIDLKQTVEEEAALKSKLEQSQCTCQSVQEAKEGEIVTSDAGAGDVTGEIPVQDGPDATSNQAEAKDFENAEVGTKTFQDGGDLESACVPNCDWHKISFELKSALEEKEVLDKDIKYLTDRVITLRQNRIAFTAEVTAARKKTEIKRRQLKKVEQKIQSCLKSKEKRLKALEAGKVGYKKAETSLIEADQQLRTVQQLLKHKMLEKTELEKRVERYKQTEELRKFSLEVKSSIPVSFGDLYPGITENSAIEYIEKVARANAAARRKAEHWTNEVEGLTIDFEDRRYPFTGTYRNTLVRVSPIRTESETHFCEDYRPPPMCFSSINTSSLKNFGLFKPSSSSYGWKKTFAKVPVLGVGLGSLKNFAVKFGNFLSYGKNIYPRTIVVNGVMYKLKDAKSAPERIYGPLTHDVWSRHIKDVRNFSQQTPNSFCQRLFRRTAPVTLGQGQPCPQTFQGQHFAQTYQGQHYTQTYQGQHYPQYFHGQQTLQGQPHVHPFQVQQYPQYFQSQYQAQTFQGQPNFQTLPCQHQQYLPTYHGQL